MLFSDVCRCIRKSDFDVAFASLRTLEVTGRQKALLFDGSVDGLVYGSSFTFDPEDGPHKIIECVARWVGYCLQTWGSPCSLN
jgi:glutamine amidotransferase-like uncharacterized protein